jgi:hypothetical protein
MFFRQSMTTPFKCNLHVNRLYATEYLHQLTQSLSRPKGSPSGGSQIDVGCGSSCWLSRSPRVHEHDMISTSFEDTRLFSLSFVLGFIRKRIAVGTPSTCRSSPAILDFYTWSEFCQLRGAVVMRA